MALTKDYDYLFKVIVIGDSCVGKSSLLLRLVDKEFDPDFNATIGIDFKIKILNLEDKIIKLQIWDSAGQDRFRAITTMYYRNSDGVILMFDVTNRNSFENIISWLHELDKYAPSNIPKILIGGKADLKLERHISYEEALEFADYWNIPYIETSSKDGKNIDESFKLISKEIKSAKKTLECDKDKVKIKNNRKNCFLCNVC